jgi:DUF1365 family protein
MSLRSCLYSGTVMHRRLRPKPHRLRYRVAWMLLDLDEIAQLPRRLRLFSYNRRNAVSFFDKDHGDGSGRPLRQQVEAHLRGAGIAPDGGPIRLLCMPRIFGFGFNPLSVYFCHRRDGTLAAVLYEVHNTFRQRHSYLIPVDPTADIQAMDLRYAFRVVVPDDRVAVAIRTADSDGLVLAAALSGDRLALTDAALLRILVVHPLLTLKVIGAIHWHALKMVLKGFRLRPRPRPPATPVTVVHAEG